MCKDLGPNNIRYSDEIANCMSYFGFSSSSEIARVRQSITLLKDCSTITAFHFGTNIIKKGLNKRIPNQHIVLITFNLLPTWKVFLISACAI